jgi:hypothetical protein
MRIHKYPINARQYTINCRHGAKILSVGVQGEIPMIWAMVNPANPPSPIRVIMMLTGEDMPEGNWDFLGTVLLEGGNYVLHVYGRSGL